MSARRPAWRVLLLALSLSGTAEAQVRSARSGQSVAPPSLRRSTLRTHLGIEVAQALLKESSAEQRQRGFERLGSIGTAQALDSLLKSFEAGGAARSTADRLIAVRALATHAAVPAVREFLVRVMVGVGSNPGRSEAIDGMIEAAAAFALARTGDESALTALGKVLCQPGHVGETAARALLAFPPRDLRPVVAGAQTPTRTAVAFFGDLGDPRAIALLRQSVRSGVGEVRSEAAVSLARLGDTDTLDLARHWLAHERGVEFRSAAARILLELHAADAGKAIVNLYDDESTRKLALELASHAVVRELAPPLIRDAESAADDERELRFAALGLTGTPSAASFLGRALGKRETSSVAALALARSPAKEADAILAHALRVPATRRAAVRASIVRALALGRSESGIGGALASLSTSNDVNDRALFVQASALLSPAKVPTLLRRSTDVELRALSRCALLPGVSRALAEQLATEPKPAAREALAAGLVSLASAELVPSDVLLALIEARGLGAPLAARALAARDSRSLRPKLSGLLLSDDALLRSHVALGLAHSSESSALGVLTRAYRFETDETVRLAIVRALAVRREPARERTLRLARDLDGSLAVRQAAALALASAAPGPDTPGSDSLWLELGSALETEATTKTGQTSVRGALVVSASGLAIPAFADPDGVLLLPALPAGPFELRLAPGTRTDNAEPRP
ncbi:MAG TPA: HEAT repeat domain-containing protein [Polyangiaceae bacterium]|nr:HEAT repeat domain-containing protein [Polyangiaceae bacterium]